MLSEEMMSCDSESYAPSFGRVCFHLTFALFGVSYARFGGLVRLCIAADKFLYRQSIGVLNYHKTLPALLSN